MGGVVVSKPEDLRFYNEEFRPLVPFQKGDEISEPPCVDVESYEAINGRECPRIELDPDNSEAAELCSLTMNETLHPLVGLFFDPSVWDDPYERMRVIRRVARALNDDEVIRLRREAAKRDPDPDTPQRSAPYRLMKGQPAPFGRGRRPRPRRRTR